MKTLIIVILDESGSMGPKKSDVIGGFNCFLDDQKKVKNAEARLYLVKFNTMVSVVYQGQDLESVPPLDDSTYTPGGGTALYDAIAHSVRLAEKDKTVEEQVVCVIMTDGEENSSKETTKQQVKDIITGKEKTGEWSFLYIGENPEQWATDYEVDTNRVAQFDGLNPRMNFNRTSNAVREGRVMMMRKRNVKATALFKFSDN